MKIALIGATGFVGTAVLQELIARGHAVTALARNPASLSPRPSLSVQALDVYDVEAVASAVHGHDAIVSAFNPGWSAPDLYALYMKGSAAIVRAAELSFVKRLLIVGGAGSLFVAPGVQLVDTPQFAEHVPANIVPGAKAARDVLSALRANVTLDWTFLSPAALLAPGERSGRYRLGGEELLMAGDSPAGVSVADLAVSIVDELERPRHVRARFTVASAAPSAGATGPA